MAVNTFLTIAIKCKEEFVIKHIKPEDNRNQLEQEPYIYELIRNI